VINLVSCKTLSKAVALGCGFAMAGYITVSHSNRKICLFIYLFICGLCNNAVSSSHYMTSNGRMIGEQ
jgi:hypothetical protein